MSGGDNPLADERYSAEVVSSEQVYTGRVWDVIKDTVRYNGDELVREYVKHPGAVAVLALDDEDRVLLIRQYRHPVRAREWEVPAGLLDEDGEDPFEAARRELAEEADCEASDWRVLAEYVTTPGGNDEAIRIYLARGITATEDAFERTAEEADIEVRWVPLDEALDAILDRRVQNPSTVVGVLSAVAHRARGWTGLAPADAPWPRRTPPRR